MNRTQFKNALTDRKISQRKMADDLGIKPQRISDMLAGRMDGWKYRSRIAKYLGIPEEILFDDETQISCPATGDKPCSVEV